MGWLVSAGYTKKGSEIECTSKLVPRFQIFFLARFTRAITLCVIGLPLQLDGCARGGAPFFLREKRAGVRATAREEDKDNARCDALHLIRLALL
ncbi:MAG: hypothetical protein II343_04570, partial [Clostridia bacterium]|nr:hypothetical protein [Clostridia bacterium]